MKTFYLMLSMLALTAFSAVAQSRPGSLQGQILTAQGKPVEGATVQLQETNFGTTTDQSGNFVLQNVPAGSYVLLVSTVGYSAVKEDIGIRGGRVTTITLQLSENRQELSEIIINGTKTGYHDRQSATALRAELPLLETPQSVQVVTAGVMQQRQAFTLNELSSSFTGLKANNGNGSFSMRGFTAYSPSDASFLLYNGIRGNLFLWSQQPLLYNVEAVELLRGPSGALFSEGAPGGVINFVTKKPLSEKRYQAELSAGSWNFLRGMVDLTGPLSTNKKLLYRAIVGYDRTNSFRDGQQKENLFVAPSLTYVFSPVTTLNLEINYAWQKAVHQYDNGSYIGSNADGTFDFNRYPANLTVQGPSDYGRATNTSGTLSFNHSFGERLRFTAVQRAVRNVLDFTDHIPVGRIRNDSISRAYQDWETDRFSLQTTAFVSYDTKTGFIKHQVTAGADYNRYGWTQNDYQYKLSTRISILHPDYRNDVPAATDPAVESDDNKRITNLAGAYLQDQLELGTKLRLLLSLRYDHYAARETPLSARDNKQGDELKTSGWIPRAGVVYLPFKNLSFYGTYVHSFNPQTSNNVRAGGPFPTRQATQFELGTKAEFLQRKLMAMFSAYQIDYANILTAAPTPENSHLQAAIDGTRSSGLELTLNGTLGQFDVIAGYGYNRHVLKSSSSYGKKGDRFANAPGHLVNTWVRYRLPARVADGLSVAAGMRYVSDQVGLLSNQNFVFPAYSVFDAALAYDRGRYGLRFNAMNLANRHYFTGSRSGVTTGGVGEPFNFRVGLSWLLR